MPKRTVPSLVPPIAGALLNLLSASALEPAEAERDKSEFSILNPTPRKLMRELSADRPDRTESPYTVDAGHFQVEMDFINFTFDRHNSQFTDTRDMGYEVAPMNLKAGLLNDLDFQLGFTPYQYGETEDRPSGSVERASGFGDLVARFKINLLGNDAGAFAIALMPYLKIPTSGNALGNNLFEGGVILPYAFQLGGWEVGMQTDFDFVANENSTGHHYEFGNSIALGHDLVGKLGFGIEFFSSVSTESNIGWSGTIDTWLTYAISEDVQLDAGVYIGVTRPAEDWHPFVGMTWRY